MRIRSIKPEFWRSDDIDALDWDTRLVFIGLWSYVDDNGVGIYKMSSIVSDLFANDFYRDPTETLSRVSEALDCLESRSMIDRYSVGDREYIHVTNWGRHQRVNNPNKPRFPLPTSENVNPIESLNSSDTGASETLPPGTGEQRISGSVDQGISGAGEAPDLNETEEEKTKDGKTNHSSASDSAPASDNSASSSRNQEPVVDMSDTRKEPSDHGTGRFADLPQEERLEAFLELARQQRKEQSA